MITAVVPNRGSISSPKPDLTEMTHQDHLPTRSRLILRSRLHSRASVPPRECDGEVEPLAWRQVSRGAGMGWSWASSEPVLLEQSGGTLCLRNANLQRAEDSQLAIMKPPNTLGGGVFKSGFCRH